MPGSLRHLALTSLVALVGCQDNTVPVAECPRCPPAQPAEPCPEPPKPPPDAALHAPRSQVATLEANRFEVMLATATDLYLLGAAPGTDGPSTAIAKLPLGGGPLAEVAVLPGAVQHAIVDGDQLVTSSLRADETTLLQRVALADGAVTILATLARGQRLDGIATDADAVYYGVWRDARKHEIRAIARRTGKDTLVHTLKHDVAADARAPAALGVDAAHLYWAYGAAATTHILMLDKAKPTGAATSASGSCDELRSLELVGDRLYVACGRTVEMYTTTPLARVWTHTLFDHAAVAADATLAVLTSRVGAESWLHLDDEGIVATLDPAAPPLDTEPTIVSRDVEPRDVVVHASGIFVLTTDAVLRIAR